MGALVNAETVEHIDLLIRQRKSLAYMKRNLGQMATKSGFFINRSLKAYQHLLQLYLQRHTEQEVEEMIDGAMEQIDDVVIRLEFERDHRPLKMIGVKATFELLYSVYTFLGTVTFAVLQSLLT